jgi:TRAP-type C4-dicarboxylate transport system permease small subunit
MIKRSSPSVDKATATLEVVIGLALLLMFVVVFMLVILRYVFGTTIIGANEATVIAFVFVTAIGASIDLFRDEHISISYFVQKLSPRSQSRLAVLRLLLMTTLNLYILVQAIVWITRTGNFMMPALGLPQWIAQSSIVVGSSLCIAYCVLRLFGRTPADATSLATDQ